MSDARFYVRFDGPSTELPWAVRRVESDALIGACADQRDAELLRQAKEDK